MNWALYMTKLRRNNEFFTLYFKKSAAHFIVCRSDGLNCGIFNGYSLLISVKNLNLCHITYNFIWGSALKFTKFAPQTYKTIFLP